MIEIERKFLVKSIIIQGYLNCDPQRTVRVRLRDQIGYITVKGKSSDS